MVASLLLFPLKIASVSHSLLSFHMKLKIIFLFLRRMPLNFLVDCVESVDDFQEHRHPHIRCGSPSDDLWNLE